jgi:glucose/arabinose dehydrogenase
MLFLSNLLVAVFFSAIISCDAEQPHTSPSASPEEEYEAEQSYKVETIVKGLQNPWGMAFLPDGRILVTERSGSIVVIKDRQIEKEKIQGVPKVYARGQGGLLDIVLHPNYATNGWIYFSYAKPGEGGGTTTVARARLNGNAWTNMQELFSVHPYVSSGVHFGSRIVFDAKGYMFISTGDRGTKKNAQDLSTHNGKVIRLHDDGRVPRDNPFVNKAGAKSEIWSYGHRNIQGLVYDASKNTLWAHEHGPKGGDELNIVQRGRNYGWPLVTYGIDYDGSKISDKKTLPGIEPPVHQWTPSIAPCGMALVTSDKYKGWKGNLLVGALSHRYVARVQVSNNKFVEEEKLLNGIGRVRAVTQAPDGFIYVLTEGPGQLLKIVPR